MRINDIELSSLGIKLYDRVITSNNVATIEDWLDGDIQPTSIRQQDSFKSIKLAFLVLADNEDDAFVRISRLTQHLRKASIKFDDINYIFDVSMTGKAEPERLKNGNFIVRYTFTSDYAKGEREVFTTNANLTNAFKLQVLYYQNSTTLLATETVTIRASSFEDTGNTLESIGIQNDKFRPQYYNTGVVTNLGNRELNYENLKNLGTLIINYAPIEYNLRVQYYMDNGTGYYNDLLEVTVPFTYPKLQSINSIGQLIDIKQYKPEGYKGTISYTGDLTVENLLAVSPLSVFYEKLETDQTKNVTFVYYAETDDGSYDIYDSSVVVFKESDFTVGMSLGDIIDVSSRVPNNYYNDGYIDGHALTDLITYDELLGSYDIKFAKKVNNIFVEYYLGVFPSWYRLTTNVIPVTYKSSYTDNFSISDIGLDVNKYKTSEYYDGMLYNGDNFDSFDQVVQAGVLQVYYRPIDYTILVRYQSDDGTMEPITEEVTINALDFIGNPTLGDIIPLTKYRPEGYQFSQANSYLEEVTLSMLTQNSPINITYEEITQARTKNIILKYKQELSSTFSTINTSIITVNEADTQGGIRLKDIFNMNLYKPDYYENGILDGASSTALLEFDEINSTYTVVYMASTYTTPVRYYIEEVSDIRWIGSSSVSYRVIDFDISTTLVDLGFNVNAYKPSYCLDGQVQYNGPVNFQALRNIDSIDVIYPESGEGGGGDDGIDYPHRFLFLQHNDLGEFEDLHPNWTMNHAYINTGVAVEDMSKLTVVMETKRVDENVPLHDVNAGYGYLFGSSSVLGSYYMRFNNQTQYGNNLTGVNTYEANAGLYTNSLVQSEASAIGFSSNSGIYQSERDGYSNAVFTYTNLLQTENAQMPYPLYLFANNNAGRYEGGLAGIGIYSCRIYYDGNLIRDFIPVEFYDKIGDQVAPSNCLYDKITKTFFEDGTGQNSFNIIDDERYEDTNLEHKIGHCYVNYYKGDTFMQNIAYYFRASDFVGGNFDAYEKFMVDTYQPSYYKSGEIVNYKNLVFDFDNMNNQVYTVIYPEQENTITVNYYTQSSSGDTTLINTETIGISEKDFLQAPTFGDIVRINKYKPDGYYTDFEYQGSKVSLARVVENSPYNIIYKPVDGELMKFNTTIRYIKKVYGIRQYEVVGTKVLEFDETMFRDGEYIDFYIDKNLYKPEKFYKDGATYQWYEMDERLDTVDKLKATYTIWYDVEPIFLDINYYVDNRDEDSLIASSTWSYTIDEFEPQYDIYLIDTLPNEYINKFKPSNCYGGVLQDSNIAYTPETLADIDEIAIIYNTRDNPHDPETASYDAKVLYWGEVNDMDYFDDINSDSTFLGGYIPYIDLGFKPKDLSRLRVEIKGYARPWGIKAGTNAYGFQDTCFTNYFGYSSYIPVSYLGKPSARKLADSQGLSANGTGESSGKVSQSSGFFSVGCRIPQASGWVYSAEGPQYIDGQVYYKASSTPGIISGDPNLIMTGVNAYYRVGKSRDYDDNYNIIKAFGDYGFERSDEEFAGYTPYVAWNRGNGDLTTRKSSAGDPYTVVLDAYNKYGAVWRDGDSNTPMTYEFDTSGDNEYFENICQPKGSLTLFQTTNPDTGEVNIMPFNVKTFPYFGLSGSLSLSSGALGNPYSQGFSSSVVVQVLVITDNSGKEPVYEIREQTKNINYAKFPIPVYPQMTGCAIWGLKIYDRDRLVRDLIPVAKGDKIYDYVMPNDGLFDLVTEIFFGNSNTGGRYTVDGYITNQQSSAQVVKTIYAEDVLPLKAIPDPTVYGKSVTNYYDYDNTFLGNQYVDIPVWYCGANERIEDLLRFNDYKPDDFHLDGMLDLDKDISFQTMTLRELFEMGAHNVYYKLKTYTKTIVYYQGNVRIGSRDLFYSYEDIDNANTIADLGIDVDLYYSENFKHGRVVFDESIIDSDDIASFIDAPSPIVVYDKLTQEEAPNLLYVEYYRGGASDDELITIDEENPNYLNCNLDATVLNPNGAIKYFNHYHQALYEDEDYDYFIPYQVKVLNKYTGIHRGPARKYQTLAMIVERDTYTIIEERNGWGRLKEYPVGWILLNQTEPMTGPGQNPDYDVADDETATIKFAEKIHITKMTIDRLWCYCPEVESWIKSEDISFDQAGRLYNGLAIEVINLDDVNWSNATSLASIGIHPEAYRLRFHDYSGFTYDGEVSYSALSQLHSIEITYPETIYHYNCHYYRYYRSPENELGTASFSCSISDWNPDWDTFISTSYRYEEDGTPINPTLYRDTEIILTWDYFGFERNLFKPEGFGDGIYMWNPRSWDKDNVKFTFSELVKCGSQYVFYPVFNPDTYKLWVQKNYLGYTRDWLYGGVQTKINAINHGIQLDLSGSYDWYDTSKSTEYGIYDIYTSGEITKPFTALNNTGNSVGTYNTKVWNGQLGEVFSGIISGEFAPYINSNAASQVPLSYLGNPTHGDYYSYNVSNLRETPTLVLGIGNKYINKEDRYYMLNERGFWDDSKWTRIYDNTNLKGYNLATNSNTALYLKTDKDYHGLLTVDFKELQGVIYDTISYENSMMIHYWVPVPKGLWYVYDGETRRMEDNGLFDLLTGRLVRSYRLEDGVIKYKTGNGTLDLVPTVDGKDLIFYRNQELDEARAYDYFKEWNYETTDCNYMVRVKEDTYTYEAPDEFALRVRTAKKDLKVPVTKYTADSANKVVGEWYFAGDQWISTDKTVMSGYLGVYDVIHEKQTICLVPTADGTFYTGLDPETVAPWSPTDTIGDRQINYGNQPRVLTTSASFVYKDGGSVVAYFDGNSWIPRRYTHNYTTTINENYAVSVDTYFYQYPIEDELYRLGTYQYGDRITATKRSRNDENWLYIGSGWIKKTPTNLSLIE